MLSSSHVETMMVNLIKKMDVTYQLFYGDDLLLGLYALTGKSTKL